ncbi:hypothetical protein [Intestinimonas massiliensis (ex Afouda et al. 2020)]|nr:hypothetical protein [Intestinimonas massiliensis (ex Afouda et al. 2020)]
MTYAEFLRRCLAADARKIGAPAGKLVRQVLNRLRRVSGPDPAP